MMEPGRDRLDNAIDEAARQLVTGTMPPSVVRSVLTAVSERAPQRPPVGWRMAAAAATFVIAASIYTYVRTPSERSTLSNVEGQSPAVAQRAVAQKPPGVDDAGGAMVPRVISRRILVGAGTIDRGSLPEPVTLSLISVAPVTMSVVEVESLTVDRVEVARVEVPPIETHSQEGIR